MYKFCPYSTLVELCLIKPLKFLKFLSPQHLHLLLYERWRGVTLYGTA
jgi:hypothetical protein